jgi:bifunctional non-homologous end joining protein LigD
VPRAKSSPARPRKERVKEPLKEYKRKRDFAKTSEPQPQPADSAGQEFVVQKHAARRLHYDLRLELDGVLKSWAVTRGPSLTVGEKRLAVRTEDHPIEYLAFEGNIPKGEYGGGSMIVWDRGRWLPDGDAHYGLQKGHLAFTLEGRRLKGRWHLVRIRPRRGEKTEPWLLMKSDDAFARHPGDQEIIEEETTSYLSGRSTEELAAEGELRTDHKARAKVTRTRKLVLPDIGKIRGARKGLLPAFLEPSLALACDKPPSGPKWVHEIKHDGYRMQARIDAGKVRLLTRKQLDWSERFSSITDAVKRLGLSSAWLDGEIIVEDANGISSFPELQADLKDGRQDRFRYYVFDILYCEGFDLSKAVLLDRKSLLEQILDGLPAGSPIRFSEHLATDGPTMLEHTCRLGLEGIVSKRADLAFRPGRGDHWLKSKCVERQEFVIVGYVPSTAASGSVGSLLLGFYEEGKLVYAGRAGTGFSSTQARALRSQLEAINTTRPTFARPLPDGAEKGVCWAKPKLVCDVEFLGRTHEPVLRAAAFKGLREDKPAEEVVLESPPKPLQEGRRAVARPKTVKGGKLVPTPPGVGKDTSGIRLTHPERILWDAQGITKQGLAEFYTDIAEWILPHITGRVLSLLRSPSGISAKGFFAKHPWHGLSDSVRRVDTGDKEAMLAIDGLPGLISLVQASVVEIHPWGSRVEHLERPDRLIFDLDPGEGVPWSAVIEAARETRSRLADLGLQSFVKTSGGKGLHVVVPIEPKNSWDEAKTFTGAVAAAMASRRPDQYVATMAKRARAGRIFIDYLRNGREATAVAAYSTRALPQASVSTPVGWDELAEGLRADHFTIHNLHHRLAFLSQDPWEGFFTIRQPLPLST